MAIILSSLDKGENIPVRIARSLISREGHVQRGIDAATPKVIKDGLRMLRYGTEGAQTLRGDPILEDIGAWDRFLQGIGFRPGPAGQPDGR